MMATGLLPAGASRSSAMVRQIMGKVAELGGDPQALAQNLGTFKADTHSLMAATRLRDAAIGYEETALKNLDVATRELHGAAATDLGPWLNKWIETGETQIGNKQVPASITAVLTFANEYAKVMSGATGAQAATVDSRREAAELFNPYFSAGQWDAVSSIARQDMANRKAALNENVDAIRRRIGQSAAGSAPLGGEQGKAERTSPAAAPKSGSVPVPEAQKSDLDGTRYNTEKGVYVKQGNWMIPEE